MSLQVLTRKQQEDLDKRMIESYRKYHNGKKRKK